MSERKGKAALRAARASNLPQEEGKDTEADEEEPKGTHEEEPEKEEGGGQTVLQPSAPAKAFKRFLFPWAMFRGPRSHPNQYFFTAPTEQSSRLSPSST